MVNGTAFNSAQTGGTVVTGANGYYYYLLSPGTITVGRNVLTDAQHYGGGAISGAAVADQSDGYPIHLDILGNTLHEETAQALWTTAKTDITTAEGGNSGVITLVGGLANLQVDAFNSTSFTIGTTMNAAGSVVVDAVGNLIINAGSVMAGGAVTLATQENFQNLTGASAITAGGGNRWLVYSTSPVTDTAGSLPDAFVQYAATFPANTAITSPLTYTGATAAATTGNGLLYSVSPTLTVTADTKTYDGTTSLPSVGSAYTTTGAIVGDTATLNAGSVTGSFASADAGSLIDVTAAGFAVTRGGIPVFGYSVGSVTGAPSARSRPRL